MFYCDPCGKKNGWPTGMPMSHGNCEICGKRKDCNDVPSKCLPFPKKEDV